MQKIAVVIPKYGLIGGAEQFAAELSERLLAEGDYDFHLFANRTKSQTAGMTFHQVPVIPFPKFLTTPSFAWFAKNQISRCDCALVHSHERILAADVFTMHGIPHRYWIHHIRRKRMSLYDLATDWVEKRLVYSGNCRKFVAVSNLTKSIFLQEYDIDPERVAVVHPGVDVHDYEQFNSDDIRCRTRNELGIDPDEPVILFASMNFEIKGLDAVLHALARLKCRDLRFKLIVAGKGNTKKYTKMAAQLNIAPHVIFTGQVPKERLIRMYLAGDMYIMLSRFDTFGMVVLEAMAAGLPVIVSHNVGARDVVEEGKNGFVIEDTADSDGIATKIRYLMEPGRHSLMSQAARETAVRNSWTAVAAKYREIYAGVIAEKMKVL